MKIIWGVIGLAGVVGICGCLYSQPPSYMKFISQEQSYYERIAGGCAALLASTPPAEADGHQMRTRGASLPAPLSELHPAYVRVSTNRVYACIDLGRGGSYGIAWQPSAGSAWELRSYSRSVEVVLFVGPRR